MLMRRVVVLVVLLVLLAAPSVAARQETPTAATPAAATPIPEAPTETVIHLMLPLGQTGLHTSLSVLERVAGTCDMPSIADPGRPDARRCVVEGGGVLDPCFQSPFAAPADLTSPLACMRDPFTSDVSLLTLLQKFDPSLIEPDLLPIEESNPWAVVLANGVTCSAMTGATYGLAGMRANYSCDDGGVLIGDPLVADPQWHVHYLERGALATTFIAVAEAWY